MKKNNELDIQGIKKSIKEKHKDFIDKVGYIPNRLDADNYLVLSMTIAKISAILICFKEEGVIDNFISKQDSQDCVSYYLSKDDFHTKVVVSTDGKQIFFHNENLLTRMDVLASSKERIMIKDINEFDWNQFSIQLLDYIHMMVYNRSQSICAKIWK